MRGVSIRAVLFDWDGTLVDTADASYRCYVRTFEDFGIPFDRAEYERTYSPNWYYTYRCVGLPEQDWPAADARWLEHFGTEVAELVPGARAALEFLDTRGVKKGIVTSGTRERIERELIAHGLVFDHVVCGTDVVEKKPHPAALELCLERLGLTPKEAAYVGDSPEDILMARAGNVLAIAVRGGYPNARALEAANPDLLADDLRSALEWALSSRA